MDKNRIVRRHATNTGGTVHRDNSVTVELRIVRRHNKFLSLILGELFT